MRLTEPLLRLPIAFDADVLAAEVAALPPHAWVPHPNNHPGNAAVRLVTTGGQQTDDTRAPMAPTEHLLASPYMREAMAAIGGTWGRSRLMSLGPGAVVPPHIDTHYYWRTHVRLHVPIITNPGVAFTCADRTVHMAAGECWIFDTFANHFVRNAGTATRVHLVLDTVGGEGLWDLVDAAGGDPRQVQRGSAQSAPLAFEHVDGSTTISPWEVKHQFAFIAEHAVTEARLADVLRRLDRFAAGWTAAWAAYGATVEGAPEYRRLIANLESDLPRLGGEHLRLRNGLPVYRQIAEFLFALNASLPQMPGLRSAA